MRALSQSTLLLLSIFSLAACKSGFSSNNVKFSSKLSQASTRIPANDCTGEFCGDYDDDPPQPNPSQGKIRFVNHKHCTNRAHVDAVYSGVDSRRVKGDLKWIIGVSSSSYAQLNELISDPRSITGQFDASTFNTGNKRFRAIENGEFFLDVPEDKLTELKNAAGSKPLAFAAYDSATNIVVSSSQSVRVSGGSSTSGIFENTSPLYEFNLRTILYTVKNEGCRGDENEACNKCDTTSSPLVIDFMDDGLSTTSLEDGVKFDIDADGKLDRVAWLGNKPQNTSHTKSFDDAFIARDLNKNNIIDNGAELFGQATKLQDGSLPANGFIALKDLDSNEDNSFDESDKEYKNLLLWVDRNKNGKTDRGETIKFHKLVKAVNLKFAVINQKDEFGNQILAESDVILRNGKSKKVVDVYFVKK